MQRARTFQHVFASSGTPSISSREMVVVNIYVDTGNRVKGSMRERVVTRLRSSGQQFDAREPLRDDPAAEILSFALDRRDLRPNRLEVRLIQRSHPQRRIELHGIFQPSLANFDGPELTLVTRELIVE